MKKVESTNWRLHGICVVGRLPKDTSKLGKRFPCTSRHTSALERKYHIEFGIQLTLTAQDDQLNKQQTSAMSCGQLWPCSYPQPFFNSWACRNQATRSFGNSCGTTSTQAPPTVQHMSISGSHRPPMKQTHLLLFLQMGLLSSCASTQICTRSITNSEPEARALLKASQAAHGGAAFDQIRDLSVRYEGKWAAIGPRFQPVLVDSMFRGASEERIILSPRVIAQTHTGPGGVKNVLRKPGQIAAAYNGAVPENAETNQAAALVEDAYALFLLGPFYFQQSGTIFAMNGESLVDQALCDEVLAILRPGFGMADEDRVILYIDRSSKLLRRVRLTLNGLDSTRGAEVDVTFRDFKTIDGVLWPTNFDERVRSPFKLHAHHWNLHGLESNRGLSARDLILGQWTDKATKPSAEIIH